MKSAAIAVIAYLSGEAPVVDRRRFHSHKLTNLAQSVLLLGAMAALLAALGWLIAGGEGVLWAAVTGVAVLALSPRASPQLTLRLYGAYPLAPAQAPGLYALIERLANRAGLARPPTLYYVPSPTLNAFAVGTRNDASIAVTSGLLRELNGRELTGVLAHELSHVANNDMWVMTLADNVSRLTGSFSFLGQLLLLLNLPLLLFGGQAISWLAIVLLILAPTLSVLLQLALSRTREFDADLEATRLTRDPLGLASALRKLERFHGSLWRRLLLPGARHRDSWVLSTHPSTAARIARLEELAAAEGRAIEPLPLTSEELLAWLYAQQSRRRPWWVLGRFEH